MDQLGKVLASFGIGKREVDIYLALVERGEMTARELSDLLAIPYTKIYVHLQRLERLGLITTTGEARPAKFRATPPMEVYRILVRQTSEILKTLKPFFDSLQIVYESRYAAATSTFLTLIRGAERVSDLINEVLSEAETEAYLALPFEELISYRLFATIVEESKRISIKVLTTVRLRAKFDLPPRVEVRAVPEMFGGGAIGGSVLIFVKHSGEISGVYSNERFIAEIAKTYFYNVWQRAK
ncbi:putative transcriptional regulator [Pyrobaculum oguniense TE7]|uniref:Transcriptional regulator n=1 Tax=Pyrobaculum oguniense (strain DSM 13380 / JCM 10595 / TE7) TaxID=698757 RepID=H6Q6W7_PYROT|nr:putative transcriptional regulator [Pyrobaculum oguniense TE7]